MSAAIEVFAGDDKTITLTVLDSDGDPVDLTGGRRVLQRGQRSGGDTVH